MKSYALINRTIRQNLNGRSLFGLLISSCLLFFFQNCTNILSSFRPHKGSSSASRGNGLCSFDRFFFSQAIDLDGSTCLSSNSITQTKLYFYPGELVLKSGQIIGDDHLFLSMQNDGNLILYVNYQAVWNSNTWGQCPGGCTAIYQEDGNFVIYSTTKAIFATGWNGSGGLAISDVQPYFLPRPKDYNPSSLQSFGQKGEKIASVGFNEEFITGYGLYKGYICPVWGGTNVSQCDNYPSISLERTQQYLDALTRMNVKVHREVVPVKYFMDSKNLNDIVTIFKEFQKRNMTIIFTPGMPLPGPQYMNGLLGISYDENITKGNFTELSNHVVNLFKGLRSSGQIDGTWLNRNVIIEPFGEFDGLPGVDQNNYVDMTSRVYGTPMRAKILHDTMETELRKQNFSNEVTAPSLVSVFQGTLSEPITHTYDGLAIWLKDYYAYGGTGRPNIHIYYYKGEAEKKTASFLRDDAISGIKRVVEKIPSRYQHNLIIGETGFPEKVSGTCEDGISSQLQKEVYTSLILDKTLNQYVDAVLFWRLAKLDPVRQDGEFIGCSSQYGVLSVDKFNSDPGYWSTFEGVALKIFESIFYQWKY